MSTPPRSPVCPKALTLEELMALPIGTRLINFSWGLIRQSVTYQGVRRTRDGVCVLLKSRNIYGVSEEIVPVGDLGLAPYPRMEARTPLVYMGWNAANVLVLPKDADALPAGPLPENRRVASGPIS